MGVRHKEEEKSGEVKGKVREDLLRYCVTLLIPKQNKKAECPTNLCELLYNIMLISHTYICKDESTYIRNEVQYTYMQIGLHLRMLNTQTHTSLNL